MFRDESKNFFYDIKISTPDGKKSARLTDTLMKQCTKIDIIEAIASEEGEQMSSATVTFIEADFLPDSLSKTPAEGVAGRGYVTNRTGALLDIRFDTEKGFTYVTPQELESGYTDSSRTKSGESEPVSFMFSNNNVVDITWGHLEPKTSRSRRFKIGTVNYAAGQGGNQLTLQCFTLQKDMARVKLSEGKAMVDKTGVPLSLKQCLYNIAFIFGARLEFDGADVTREQMSNYTPPSDYVLDRTKVGGDTKVSSDNNPEYIVRTIGLDAWLRKLALEFNSVYEVFEDPLVGIPVIKFTSKAIRYKKVIRTLNYRDPKGVMLDFQFNTISGEVNKEATASAIDENGTAESSYKEVRLTDGRASQKPANTYDPIPLVYNTRARESFERDLYGISLTVPGTSESDTKSAANTSTYNNSFMGFITVKTVGHPDFEPDVMNVQGVGVRASTTYRFFQVQHSLGTAGYTCNMQGKTQESVQQGLPNSDQLKGNVDYIKPRLSDPRLN